MSRWVLGAIAGAGVLAFLSVVAGSGEAGGASAGGGLLAGVVVALAAGLGVLWSRQRGLEAERERLHALVARADDQLRLGEQLGRQSEALPVAAEALSGLAERIAALESSWASTHRQATEETLGVVRDAILAFRADAKQAIEEGARVAKEAVTPLVETLVEGAGRAGREVIAEQSARFADLELAQQARGEALLTRLGEVVAALDEAQRGQAAERVELEARLVEAGSAAVDAMRAGLDAHAVTLAERLDAAGSTVDAAAVLAKTGGAELSALAEMFGASVDRHNEGARAWLESLSVVDAAVESAGRGAAAKALEAQLAQTKGVFARQLEFQRELFEQVRGLRDEVTALAGEPAGEAVGAMAAPAGSEESAGV